ncbi:hypothetical protein ASG20_18495 [Sphingomonas sp. Leaf198]|jgi:hypothetical protein|nr:hypothetical protein ASG20_18495 [Sphingomonas sp. Leaf198]RMB39416.1 hypothetical protein C8J47_0013 [Sphingomonas sp. PP-F2F-G114-C0414]
MLPFLAACREDRPPDGHFGRVVGFLQANDIVVGFTQPVSMSVGSRIVIRGGTGCAAQSLLTYHKLVMDQARRILASP